jgi:hypothetical protein
MKRSARRCAAALLGAAVAATAAPALADPVDVTVQTSAGSRQFAVQDLTGAALTGIHLGPGGQQPFRTTVADQGFQDLTAGYTVTAKMNNLYLHTGDPSAPDYSVAVPSSAVSLQYGTSPLSALGLDLSVLPKLSITGTLQSCADLDAGVKTALGLDPLGAVLDLTDTALLNLCDKLLVADNTAVTLAVDSMLQQVQPAVSDLADLPAALTGAQPGAFTHPDFSAGTIGAGDTAGAAAASGPATTLSVMTGTPGMSTALSNAIATSVNDAIGTLPLTTGDGTPAQAALADVVAALSSSADAGVAAVGTALGALDATRQSALANTLVADLVPPALADILSMSGQYHAFPVLKATPTTPQPGVYKGTLTVTFVQQ